MTRRVAVIGGGIAGLSAAIAARDHGLEPVVLEASDRLGGRMCTQLLAGKPVDVGAQFVAAFNREALRMIEAEAADVRLLPSRAAAVIRRGGMETRASSRRQLLAGPLLSPAAKLRLAGALLPLLRHWRHLSVEDIALAETVAPESMSSFGRRWIGREATQELLGPVLRGLLYWELETTSAGVVLLMLKEAVRSNATYVPAGGMRSIVAALGRGIPATTGAAVRSVETRGRRVAVRFERQGAEEELLVDGAVIATTADEAASLSGDLAVDAQKFLASVAYSRSAMVCYSVPLESRPPASVTLFSPSEVPLITGLNPRRHLLDEDDRDLILTVSLTDAGFERWGDLPDRALADNVSSAVERSGTAGRWLRDSSVLHVQRWRRALPLFTPGYGRAIMQLRERQAAWHVPVVLAGDYLGGPLIEGAVRSGQAAAEALRAKLD